MESSLQHTNGIPVKEHQLQTTTKVVRFLLLLLWLYSPKSSFCVQNITSPHLSIHCFSFPIYYAQYLLGILLDCLNPSSSRSAYREFATHCIYNIFLGTRFMSILHSLADATDQYKMTIPSAHTMICDDL